MRLQKKSFAAYKIELIRRDDLLENENGAIYYNYSSDIIFVRTSIHDFGLYHFDICEKTDQLLNCVYIGDL